MKIKYSIILLIILFLGVTVSLAVDGGSKKDQHENISEKQKNIDIHDASDRHEAASVAEPCGHGHSYDEAESNGHAINDTEFFDDMHEQTIDNSSKQSSSILHSECDGHDHGAPEGGPDHDPDNNPDHETHVTDSCSDGHGHAHEVDGSAPVEERAANFCEHSVPVYQCDECRYEAGIVKVDSGLLKQENGNGLIRTQSVAKMNVSASLHATGEIALNDNATAHISPRISGIIDTVSADIGMRVKTGDSLFALTSVELGRALAEYERNRALSDLAEKTLNRETKLRKQKISSEQDMIDAQMVYEQHRTDLLASEQTLHVLGLNEDDLAVMRQAPHGINAGRLTVRSPIEGTVLEKHAVTGELVDSGSDIMLISDISNVWVWANLYSRDLSTLLSAQQRGPVKAVITVPAFPEHPFMGTVDYVGAVMDEETRTVKVRISVPNSEHLLRPGMFCNVDIGISNGTAEEVIAVPRNAILSDEGKSFVFSHWKENFYALKDVQTGREFLGMVEIVNGLQAGETIVSEGSFLLKSDVLRAKMGAGCADH